MKKIVVGIIVVILPVLLLANISAASSGNLFNPGFETGDLTGWSLGTVVDFAGVVSADGYAMPNEGNYMVRLGTPRFAGQPIGSNAIYQDFIVAELTLKFAYNIFTYDSAGYNHFHYLVKDLTTGSIILYFSQGAWGSGSGLKYTGWQVVEVDLSPYIGHTLRLEIDAGGTGDQYYATWAYVDGIEKIIETTATLVGTPGLEGWYISNVNVILEATCFRGSCIATEYSFDGVNWITYSTPFTISSEGRTIVYYRSMDNLGNIEPTQFLMVKIDKTAPVTQATLEGTFDGSSYTSDVVVTLDASDGVSGVASTAYSLDGSIWQEYLGSFVVSTDGSYLLKYRSIDKAGNIEVEKNVSFSIARGNCGLEFVIRFDVFSKDIKVYNSQTGEEVNHVVLADKQVGWELRKYTLESGNKSAELHLKYGKGGNDVKVKVVAMRYNGGSILAAPGNELKVEYSRDKSGSIMEMVQNIVVKDILQVFAKYSAKKSETEINLKLGKNSSRETVAGIAALKLLTDNGSLKYGGY